jgi:hypothetical protein
VAPPKRGASRRTAAAVAEDLVQVRRVGGIWRAGETDLVATLDLLSLSGVPPDGALSRARDLFVSYIKRGCERHRVRNDGDKTSMSAAISLESLLLRPSSDSRLAQVIRRESAKAAGHRISPDAVRHREDKIIKEIAEEVFFDLENQRTDEPHSVEAAIHYLAPIASDLRQQLHDGLCLTYLKVPPADPRERKAIEGFYRQAAIKLGELLLASVQLAKLGLKTANITPDEYWFVDRSIEVGHYLFDEASDRSYMLDFVRADESRTYDESIERLLATERGRELFNRWVEWAR